MMPIHQYKAYLRGAIISYSTARKREALREQLNLEQQLADLDKQLKGNYSATLFKKQKPHGQLLTNSWRNRQNLSIFYAKHRLLEMGDKPGQLLAQLVAGSCDFRPIASLKDKTAFMKNFTPRNPLHHHFVYRVF